MRASYRRLAFAVAIAALTAMGGEASAQTYQWEYSINGGSFTTEDPNTTDSVTVGSITISINPSNNNPGLSQGAELTNEITVSNSSTTTTYAVVVKLTQTDYTAPTTSGTFSANIGSATVQRTTSLGTPPNANGTVGATAYLDGTDANYGTQYATNTYSESSGTVSSGTYDLSSATLNYPSNPLNPGSPFAMTVVGTFDLQHNTTAHVDIDSTFVPPSSVPEPSSMYIAGLGSLGMIGYGLRRRKARGPDPTPST
jgi:hypothetical protein